MDAGLCICILAALSLTAVELLEVHGPDGNIAWLNTAEISALRQPNNTDLHRAFPPGTHCIITTTNGKFVAAIESCRDIKSRLTGRNE